MTEDHDDHRDRLRAAEVELMLQRESVAELRRALPPQPLDRSYDLVVARERGDDRRAGMPVSLDDLVGGSRPLVLYHLMYGKAQTETCPMCAMWLDGWNAVAHHVRERADLAIVAAAPAGDLAALATGRGWDGLDFYSAGDSTLKADYGSEDEAGHQTPVISVFDRDPGGPVRHRYTGGAHLEGDHWRGVDLLSPVWHLLDLTPDGRGDWMPSVS